MKSAYVVLLSLLSGCCFGTCEPAPEPTVVQSTFLPYKQPNRDPSYPTMVVLRDEGDGTYTEMPRHFDLGLEGRSFEWGKRYTVDITSTHNPTWQHTSSRVTAVIEEKEEVTGEFRLHSISAPFFGDSKRSFVDGKKFACSSDEVCGQLDQRIADAKRFDLGMAFGSNAASPLVVRSVEDPTCYDVMDCTVRQDCCDQGEKFVCLADDGACPEGKRVGVRRNDYLKTQRM